MGNCMSTQDTDGAEKVTSGSSMINHQLEQDSRELENEPENKILILGSGESGKSTLIKQMKILHQNGFTENELTVYRLTIYCNTLDSAQAIVLAMRKLGYNFVDPANHVNADIISNYQVDPSPSFVFSSDIAQAIHQLWNDPIIPMLMDRANEFYLMDNAVYFFRNVQRIGSATYRPTEKDVLRACRKTIGTIETRLTMGQLRIRMIDVGGRRSERKKWIHCFESVTSIIFCASLSEYDQMLLEDNNQNRMADSLMLFESVVNSKWFCRTSIVLLLNKLDVFKAKLPKVPLELYFPEYSGGADINKALKFVLWKFMQTNDRAHLPIYPHLTQAISTNICLVQGTNSTTNVCLLHGAVKEVILRNALKNTDIL